MNQSGDSSLPSIPHPSAFILSLNHLGSEVGDFHKAFVAKLAGDRTEDAGAARVSFGVDQHHGVAVEADIAAVRAAGCPLDAHHDALDHVARLDVAAGNRLLD